MVPRHSVDGPRTVQSVCLEQVEAMMSRTCTAGQTIQHFEVRHEEGCGKKVARNADKVAKNYLNEGVEIMNDGHFREQDFLNSHRCGKWSSRC